MSENSELKMELDDLQSRSRSIEHEELEKLLAEARTLLKKSVQTEHEEDARKIFRFIRDRIESGSSSTATTSSTTESVTKDALLKRIQKERNRIDTGIMADVGLAINGLGDVLKQADYQDIQTRQEALKVLKLITEQGLNAREKVENYLRSEEFQGNTDVSDFLSQLGGSERKRETTSSNNNEAISNNSSSNIANSDSSIKEKLDSARRKYYAGEYYETIDILSDVLRVDKDNKEALDRLALSEDNIKRGVVPDTRVPFEARAAFGRGQSLERAKKYTEAKVAFNEALQEASKGGRELINWSPAVEALLRIEQEIIAQQTLEEADALMRQDKWRDAIEKYQIVLNLSPGDVKAQENIELLSKVQEQFETARIQLTAMTGSLAEMAQIVVDLKSSIQSLRPRMPQSKLLESMDSDIKAKARNLKSRMIERASNLMTQVTLTPAISERKRMLTEVTKILDQSLLIDSDDEVFETAQIASLELTKVTDAEKSLIEARRYINSNTEIDARMAKDKLRELREYNQDPIFRQIIAMLLRQYIDRAEEAIREKRFDQASFWISGAKEEPFKLLGRSDEVYRLEQDVELGRRQPLVRLGIYITMALLFIIITIGLSRPFWSPAINNTVTPIVTSTDDVPPTLTPTIEFVSTMTNTATPTQAPVYGAITEDIVARILPSTSSPYAFYLKTSDLVEVVEQSRDAGGVLWYKVRVASGDVKLEGWVQGYFINVAATPIP